MRHKVKYYVEVEKRGFFGKTKIVLEERTAYVSGKEYRRMKGKKRNQPDEIDEMLFYDDIIFEEDDF